MLPANCIAFKEWAVICAALADGRQSLIVRKGGIQEGPSGFRVEHREFWLFPTYLHQKPEALADESRPLLDRVQGEQPAAGAVHLGLYAVVEDVVSVTDESLLTRLTGLHVWSHRTLSERFHYRRPGLFVLTVRMYRLPNPIVIPDSPHFAGCRTWIDLPSEPPLSTAGLMPVVSDKEFARQRQAIQAAVQFAIA
ncbi:MAG: DUF1802 family protein [Planctomycetales bacterium]|nr:DUF1802 family protein [Planctomycetales bacterium]